MARLAENYYGKSRVRLMKVRRAGETHDVYEWSVGVYLEGPFESCFTEGDNSQTLPTDTMKNTVYAVARGSQATTLEDFAIELARFLVERNAQVSSVRITVEEKMWIRLKAGGEKHGSAFIQRGPDVATTEVTLVPGGVPAVVSGVKGLVILKTSRSAFKGFLRDSLTTLPEAEDRLLGTEATMTWSYPEPVGDFAGVRKGLMDLLLTTFAEHESLSVQHTLYAMAEAALAAERLIGEMSLTMPNRHNLLVDLGRFGQDNPNEIFVPTDEPHGQIFARVKR